MALVIGNMSDHRLGVPGAVPSGQAHGGAISVELGGVAVPRSAISALVAQYAAPGADAAPQPADAAAAAAADAGATAAADVPAPRIEDLRVAAQHERAVLLRWRWGGGAGGAGSAGGAGGDGGAGARAARAAGWGRFVQGRFDGEEAVEGEQLGELPGAGSLGGALVLEGTRDGNHTLALRAVPPPPFPVLTGQV
jgi:hypothetical protein